MFSRPNKIEIPICEIEIIFKKVAKWKKLRGELKTFEWHLKKKLPL